MSPTYSAMQLTVNRSLVKYAAGMAMFCPLCRTILDAKRTVTVTVRETDKTQIACGACWDKELRPKIEARGRMAEVDVLDGRELWKRDAGRNAKALV